MDKTRAVRGIAGRKKSETKSLRLESQPIYPEPVYKNSSIGQTKALMTELKRQNFHGAFCVEYEYHWENSQPEIAECVKFFNATCDELVAAGAK
jgi:hypothetical protein